MSEITFRQRTTRMRVCSVSFDDRVVVKPVDEWEALATEILRRTMEYKGFVQFAKDMHKSHGCKGSESFETCTAELCVMARSEVVFEE